METFVDVFVPSTWRDIDRSPVLDKTTIDVRSSVLHSVPTDEQEKSKHLIETFFVECLLHLFQCEASRYGDRSFPETEAMIEISVRTGQLAFRARKM